MAVTERMDSERGLECFHSEKGRWGSSESRWEHGRVTVGFGAGRQSESERVERIERESEDGNGGKRELSVLKLQHTDG